MIDVIQSRLPPHRPSRVTDGTCQCPKCSSGRTTVTDVREATIGRRRRRICEACSHAWTTYEVSREAAQAASWLFTLTPERRAVLQRISRALADLV
jgi:hypothetical protein